MLRSYEIYMDSSSWVGLTSLVSLGVPPKRVRSAPRTGFGTYPESMVATEVREYLDAVDGERGTALRAVFDTVGEAMPEGFELGIHFGMPGWVVPLSTYPTTYNGKPLAYVSLAAQKNYNSLYLMCLAAGSDEEKAFRDAWVATGRTLDMGKSCLRFRTADSVDLELIAHTVAATSVDDLISLYEASRAAARR